jgi:cytochrome c-type biogenesis protein CcmH/NrfG
MSTDPSNQTEAEKLFKQALKFDPSNETVLTMFAIFKCNR